MLLNTRGGEMPELKLPQLIIILVIILLLFGGKKLPELSKSVGRSIRELRDSVADKDQKDVKVKEEPAE